MRKTDKVVLNALKFGQGYLLPQLRVQERCAVRRSVDREDFQGRYLPIYCQQASVRLAPTLAQTLAVAVMDASLAYG